MFVILIRIFHIRVIESNYRLAKKKRFLAASFNIKLYIFFNI